MGRRDALGDLARLARNPPQQYVCGSESCSIGRRCDLLTAHERVPGAEKGQTSNGDDGDETHDERAARPSTVVTPRAVHRCHRPPPSAHDDAVSTTVTSITRCSSCTVVHTKS